MKEIILKEKNEIQINDYMNKFLEYIDVSTNTVKTYGVGLKMFSNYLKEKNIKNPCREDIIEFRENIKKMYQPTTVNSYLIAIRNFYNWLEYEGITKDITKKIKSINIGNEHKRESLSIEQCKNILSKAKNIREKVIFSLAVTCGIRANELVNIRLEDFKNKQGTTCLYLLGKARDYKEDYVIISDDMLEMIKEYIEQYKIKDYLFTSTSNNNTNGKLTTKTIRLIVKEMFRRAGIEGKEYSCHSCRHTFATLSIQNGTDIREVSQALRHKSISTTQIYLHDLEKINNKCSNKVSNLLFN